MPLFLSSAPPFGRLQVRDHTSSHNAWQERVHQEVQKAQRSTQACESPWLPNTAEEEIPPKLAELSVRLAKRA